MDATSVDRWAVTPSISVEGSIARATQASLRLVDGRRDTLFSTKSRVLAVARGRCRLATRAHAAVRARKTPYATDQKMRWSTRVRVGSTHKG